MKNLNDIMTKTYMFHIKMKVRKKWSMTHAKLKFNWLKFILNDLHSYWILLSFLHIPVDYDYLHGYHVCGLYGGLHFVCAICFVVGIIQWRLGKKLCLWQIHLSNGMLMNVRMILCKHCLLYMLGKNLQGIKMVAIELGTKSICIETKSIKITSKKTI